MIRRRLNHALAIAIILTTLVPFLISQNAWAEWANSFYFFTEKRGGLFRELRLGYFVHTVQSGVFYPIGLFYGGFATHLLSAVTSLFSPFHAFAVTLAIGYASLYFGTYWLIGLVSSLQHIKSRCAIGVAISPYSVTLLYGRGAWSELLGFSFSVLALGMAKEVLCRKSPPRSTFFAGYSVTVSLAVSVHNLSLLLSFLILLPMIGLFAMLRARPVSNLSSSRYGSFGLASLAGLLLPGLYLLPNLWYSHLTDISKWRIMHTASNFSESKILLSPFLLFPQKQQQIHEAVWGTTVDVRLFNQTLIVMLWLVTCVSIVIAVMSRKKVIYTGTMLAVTVIPWLLLLLQIGVAKWDSPVWPIYLIQFPYRTTLHITLSIALSAAYFWNFVSNNFHLRKLNWLFTAAVFWYVVLAMFQSSTAKYSAPPGFDRPSLETISRGDPPPLFSGNTAAPKQFRMSELLNRVTNVGSKINFDSEGQLLANQYLELRIRRTSHKDDLPAPIIQTGGHGRATTIGIGQNSTQLILVIDRWGLQPLELSLGDFRGGCCFELDFEFRWATSSLIIRDGVDSEWKIENIVSDTPMLVHLNQNLAGSTVIGVHEGFQATLIAESVTPGAVSTGRYETNVVASPLTGWHGATAIGLSENAMWVIDTSISHPEVTLARPTPVVIGYLFSLSGLVLIIFLLLRGFPTNTEKRNSKGYCDNALNCF